MEEAIIFGRGNYFKKKQRDIENNYRIIGFLDNSVSEKETYCDEIYGVPVVNPERVFEFPKCPIILMSTAFIDMWEQLKELNVSIDRIKFGTEFIPDYNDDEQFFHCNGWRIEAKQDTIILRKNNFEEILRAKNKYEFQEKIRIIYREEKKDINAICGLDVKPISRRWGIEHGKPIDRFYIEAFLEQNKSMIRGSVMEVAENTYTMIYGSKVKNSYILHVNGWGENAIKGDLESGHGIIESSIDCFICTQTLQFIYDISSAVSNIYKMLKPGGIALITAHGIAQISTYDYSNWGEYWRFTKKSLEKLFMQYFKRDQIEVNSFGNVKIATALLYGLAVEDMIMEDFEYNDEQYPVVFTIKVKK